jgi:hypothetical protein
MAWNLSTPDWQNRIRTGQSLIPDLPARYSPPDVAFHCRDYAMHLRTIAECFRMDMLEKDIFNEGEATCKNIG